MIRERAYPVDPWHIRETRLDLDLLAQSESVFALANGHIGIRGNLDEGEPHGLPGTYLNSFYELRPLPYAEAGYGFPESGQTMINVTNAKLMRLLVDDEPFDVRYGELRSHERVLDLRAGTLERTVEWVSPSGQAIRVRTVRLVSFTQRAVVAFLYEVEPLDASARLILQSELVANEQLPPMSKDPRVAAVLDHPLQAEEMLEQRTGGLLVHRTKASDLRMAAAMEHLVEAPGKHAITTEGHPDWLRTTVATKLEPGQKLRVVKLAAYGWSGSRSLPAIRDQVGAALASARLDGWEGLVDAQREYLDAFWDHSDVKVEGDPEVQQAVRFGLFHTLQAGARAEQRPIGSKGLSGPGYDGHTFWDAETFVLPALTYTQPSAAADVLRWRHSTLDLARERAQTLGLQGAAFPWRTIRGQECSAYWPAGTAGFHIDGVTGPDEYTAVVDDNIYTNLMAQQNMFSAVEAAKRHPDLARRLGVDDEEMASWRDAAAAVHIPYDRELQVHQQSEGFTRLQEWDFENTPPEAYPLLLNYPYFDLYRKQVVKQADLVMAMYIRGDAFTPEEKLRNFAYYDARTVRDSSLSACIQAVLAAEVGHLELAHDYLGEAALMDLHDLHQNSRDGVHVASLAGTWISLIAGLGGMRDFNGQLSFAPRLPSRINNLEFSLLWRGLRLRVNVTADDVTYSLRNGGGSARLVLLHHGKEVEVTQVKPVSVPIPPAGPVGPPPTQPAGRAPVRRAPQD